MILCSVLKNSLDKSLRSFCFFSFRKRELNANFRWDIFGIADMQIEVCLCLFIMFYSDLKTPGKLSNA